MTARSPSAVFLSALFHGTVAGAVLLFAWLAQKNAVPAPQIFELVAGEGDNFNTTVAPALGTSDGAKITVPRVIRAPKPIPDPKPQPVTEALVVTSQTPTKPATKPTTPATTVASARMTQEEFLRQNPQKPATSPKTTTPNVPRINAQGIVGGVAGGSTANTKGGAGGKALTRAESDAMDAYYSLLTQRLREAHQKPDGLSDLLQAVAEYRLNADGSITGVRIVQPSGIASFDASVLAAFRRMTPLPPPPNRTAVTGRATFKMRDDA